MAAGRAACAEQTAAQTRWRLQAAAIAGERNEPGLGLRHRFDACANGQSQKLLVVTDEWTREALTIDVQGSLRSRRVIEVLSRSVSEHGARRCLRSDSRPELTSHAVQKWLQQEGSEDAHTEPGTPWQHGAAESLNGSSKTNA
jgi:transposase InsO family protein